MDGELTIALPSARVQHWELHNRTYGSVWLVTLQRYTLE